LGVVAGAAHLMTSRIVRADKEAELLFRGREYQRAIADYYEAGKTVKSYPHNLEDLVNDPRYPNRHYLRRLYKDPMTGGDWELVRAPDGGISGVFSGAPGKPLKQGRFPPSERGFANAASYGGWLFEYTPVGAGAPGPRSGSGSGSANSGIPGSGTNSGIQ